MNYIKQKISTLSGLIVFCLPLLAIGGWVANIVKLFAIMNADITGMFILRIVGIFAVPLGVVLGFL